MSNVQPLPQRQPQPAAKPRLSDALLRTLRADGTERTYPDDQARGLRLKVTAKGAMVWQFQVRVPGQKAPRKIKIGSYPAITLARARKEARRLRAEVDAGRDPVAERKAEQAAREAADARSLDRLIETFQRQHVARLKPKTQAIYRLALRDHIEPAWQGTPVGEIDRAAVHQLLDPLRNAGRDSMARSVHSVVRQLLALAVDRGWLDHNPAEGVRRSAPPRARQRILSDDEVRWFWTATAQMGRYGSAFRLLLATAQRRSEVAGLRWDELDLDAATWTLPAERSKNNQPHVVDLCPLALAELHRIPRGDSPFVLGQGAPLGNWPARKRELDARMAALARAEGHPEPGAWVTHDARRTSASLMAQLGIDAQTIEAVLNHKGGATTSLMAIYQQYDRRPERREAIHRLGDHIAQLVDAKY